MLLAVASGTVQGSCCRGRVPASQRVTLVAYSSRPPGQAIGEDEEELGGFVTTENFLRLRDTSTCGKMQVRQRGSAGAAGQGSAVRRAQL